MQKTLENKTAQKAFAFKALMFKGILFVLCGAAGLVFNSDVNELLGLDSQTSFVLFGFVCLIGSADIILANVAFKNRDRK